MIADTQDATYAVLKYNLTRFLPIRVVISNKDGNYLGLVEDSWCLSRSDTRVRLWWSGRAYSLLGEHEINGIHDAEINALPDDLIIDPLSDESPIEIDWEAWVTAKTKFDQRNALFKVKELG